MRYMHCLCHKPGKMCCVRYVHGNSKHQGYNMAILGEDIGSSAKVSEVDLPPTLDSTYVYVRWMS